MSYEALADRLINTQRPMLGKRAADIARSIDGLEVDDDGTVTLAPGELESREILAALVDEYTTIMGRSAQSRLEAAAADFEGDVVLPENLGGPAEPPDDAAAAETDTSAVTDSAVLDDVPSQPVRKATNPPTVDDITESSRTDQSEGATSNPPNTSQDGTVAESHATVTELWETDDRGGSPTDSTSSATESIDAVTETADSDTETAAGVTDTIDSATETPGSNDSPTEPTAENDSVSETADSNDSPTETADIDDSAADSHSSDASPESTADPEAADDPGLTGLESVYVTTTDENGWESPTPVETAIANKVVDETEVEPAAIDSLDTYVETERIRDLLTTEQSIPVSFRVEGHSVTLHPDGHITVG